MPSLSCIEHLIISAAFIWAPTPRSSCNSNFVNSRQLYSTNYIVSAISHYFVRLLNHIILFLVLANRSKDSIGSRSTEELPESQFSSITHQLVYRYPTAQVRTIYLPAKFLRLVNHHKTKLYDRKQLNQPTMPAYWCPLPLPTAPQNEKR